MTKNLTDDQLIDLSRELLNKDDGYEVYSSDLNCGAKKRIWCRHLLAKLKLSKFQQDATARNLEAKLNDWDQQIEKIDSDNLQLALQQSQIQSRSQQGIDLKPAQQVSWGTDSLPGAPTATPTASHTDSQPHRQPHRQPATGHRQPVDTSVAHRQPHRQTATPTASHRAPKHTDSQPTLLLHTDRQPHRQPATAHRSTPTATPTASHTDTDSHTDRQPHRQPATPTAQPQGTDSHTDSQPNFFCVFPGNHHHVNNTTLCNSFVALRLRNSINLCFW